MALAPPPAAGLSARIAPGSVRDIGWLNAFIAHVVGAATGGGPPNLFTTLARHRGLFRKWLRFAGGLMPGGVLPRADSELLILRVAHNSGCEYEWRHHEHIARTAGLSAAQIERVREGHRTDGWSHRQEVLLRAADELHLERTISDQLWEQLRPLMSDVELIELCMLVGHYEMLAMTLNALRVEPDVLPEGQAPRVMRALRPILERRRRAAGNGA